jgi:nitrate reductase gamma subunit
MSYRVDPTFLKQLKDIEACFNCGNCTAVCPHSEGYDTFPRRLIRYGQIGLKDAVAGSKELWVCYYCGECSDTCPREAEPGEFMAAARRYAIASNDPTGLARALYTSRWANIATFVAATAILLLLLLRGAGPLSGTFFEFISGEKIHNVGVGVLVITVLAILVGIVNMIRRVSAAADYTLATGDEAAASAKTGRGLWAALSEVFTQRRFAKCQTATSSSHQNHGLRRWTHWLILWGFVALFFATLWDWLDALPDGTLMPLTYPPRLIGTLGGLAFLIGTGIALWQRIRPTTKYAGNSVFSDWVLILWLFLLALTGFTLEILTYSAPATTAGNVVLLVHIVLAMELILMLPFSKLAHVVYRTLAIFIHEYRGSTAVASAQQKQIRIA